jgi:hypothetical protein
LYGRLVIVRARTEQWLIKNALFAEENTLNLAPVESAEFQWYQCRAGIKTSTAD